MRERPKGSDPAFHSRVFWGPRIAPLHHQTEFVRATSDGKGVTSKYFIGIRDGNADAFNGLAFARSEKSEFCWGWECSFGFHLGAMPHAALSRLVPLSYSSCLLPIPPAQ